MGGRVDVLLCPHLDKVRSLINESTGNIPACTLILLNLECRLELLSPLDIRMSQQYHLKIVPVRVPYIGFPALCWEILGDGEEAWGRWDLGRGGTSNSLPSAVSWGVNFYQLTKKKKR